MKEKRLRVLQLGKFYPIKGGVEKVMYDLTTGFAERFSHKVICDMMCADGEKGSRTIHLGGNARLICCRTLWKVAATMISPSMIHTLKRSAGTMTSSMCIILTQWLVLPCSFPVIKGRWCSTGTVTYRSKKCC